MVVCTLVDGNSVPLCLVHHPNAQGFLGVMTQCCFFKFQIPEKHRPLEIWDEKNLYGNFQMIPFSWASMFQLFFPQNMLWDPLACISIPSFLRYLNTVLKLGYFTSAFCIFSNLHCRHVYSCICPLVTTGNWFQDPLKIPKSLDALS